MQHWLSAARPRTLPLALASILMGSFLAASQGSFRWVIFVLAALTTVFLQVLSNFANDYGDTVNGIDTAERTVAMRAVQSGKITARQMRVAIGLFSILSFISGITLLFVAFRDGSARDWLIFLALGLLSIGAAITYTVGRRPYGYLGLGDLSVLLFFGWVGVLGTFYLHTRTFDWGLLLPATSCGLLAVGVLNVNNIRDIDSDRRNGKNSIPVRLGKVRATHYHWALLLSGFGCAVLYVALHYQSAWQWLFLVSLPLLLHIGRGVARGQKPAEIDPYLKQLALTTLLFVLAFGIGQVL
ncbi:MAG: 1,4-dihydroxy-2-naphthoate polyprenyltransferase [Sphingobacteriaceae bacterium]|nr:1,4-dihydroxy-2-naphthoate polyprenyltransferase [Cytophagaceae bacterium]